MLWLELLHLFTAVKNLYLSGEFCTTPHGSSLGRMIEVLPTLQNIFLEGLRPSVPVLPHDSSPEGFKASLTGAGVAVVSRQPLEHMLNT